MQNDKLKTYDSLRRRRISHFLAFIVCIFIFTFVIGCPPPIKKPLEICDGKANVAEVFAELQSQSAKMIAFSTKGNFSVEYYDDDAEKHKQHFSITVFLVKPPDQIYMQASTGIISKAVVLGSNENEFWLEAKPDPLSSYWWGSWSQQNSDAGLIINPATILEALGIAAIDTTADWSLSNEKGFDVLTKTVDGNIIKKLYVYCCDKRVHKIEYFENGKTTAIAELENYTAVSEESEFFIPASIVVKSQNSEPQETFNLDLTLESIKPASQKHLDFEIKRTEPQGFDHVYHVINGQWYEQ